MFPAVSEYTRCLKTRTPDNKRIMSLEKATDQVKDILAQGTDEAAQQIISVLTRGSNVGNQIARRKLVKLIHSILIQRNIHVKGFSTDELARKIYEEAYGLSIIQQVYDDPQVEEVFWNRPDRIFKVVNNQPILCEGLAFRSEEHSLKILARLTRGATAGEATQSNPVNRTAIDDGTRVSWRIPPVSTHVAVNLRKHVSNRYITEEDYISKGIVSKDVMDVIKALAMSHAAVGLIGSGGSGKTTMLKLICKIIHDNTRPRMFVIERVRELRLAEFLRETGTNDENVVEVEEGPGVDLSMLFQNAMQAFVQLLIQGEILGWEEVANMLNVYRRGHSAGFFTGHAFPHNLPDTLATLYCEAKSQNIEAVTRSMYSVLDGSIHIDRTPKYYRKVVSIYEYYVDGSKNVARPIYEYDIDKDADRFWPIQSPALKLRLERLRLIPGQDMLYKRLYDIGVLREGK